MSAQPSTSPTKSAPKLLDRVRQAMRTNRYSPRTEAAYVDWIKRFIGFMAFGSHRKLVPKK